MLQLKQLVALIAGEQVLDDLVDLVVEVESGQDARSHQIASSLSDGNARRVELPKAGGILKPICSMAMKQEQLQASVDRLEVQQQAMQSALTLGMSRAFRASSCFTFSW